MPPNTIIQIISSLPGWRVVFRTQNGVGTEPVVCWALAQRDHSAETEVRAMAALAGTITDATLAENYLGVVGPEDDPGSLVNH